MVIDTLNKFFGEDWIKSELKKVKISGYKDLNPMNLAALDMHPIIKATVETQMKLAWLKDKQDQGFPNHR